MVIFIYLFMIAAFVLILVGLTTSSELKGVRERLPQEGTQAKKVNILHYVFPFTRKMLEKSKVDVKIKLRLDTAHVRLMPDEFLNLKLLIMIAMGALSVLAVGKFVPWVCLVAVALGYIIPEVWLQRRIAQRKNQVKRHLPETVDLLGLCVEAGLDFTTALKWIIDKKIFTNPMIEELALVLEEIKWGKPRAQALRDMSKRLRITEVSSFARLLIQAERMGTPVAEAFTIISEDTRLQRFRQGERYAMKAPIKILIPLIFCILPVIGIIVGGPIILRFLEGGVSIMK